MNTHSLIQKYDVPTPRYTSYPTVPYWDESSFDKNLWKTKVLETFTRTQTEGVSLYIHLPFCEQLCTYCGCNKRITVNHQVEKPYLDAVLNEWNLYSNLFEKKVLISEIHLGGGTPTFFSPQNLAKLIKKILKKGFITEKSELSLEVHPNYTSVEHLKVLYDLGFRRLSVGIQDFDEKVQHIINRIQTFEQTEHIFEVARNVGFDSINADIIFGLPLQTEESITLTIQKIKKLRPERIAFYSYAHVPWKSAAQRRYTETDLPQGEQKRRLYELGKSLLLAQNYQEIGLDHFALPEDQLLISQKQGILHRNFMGYTSNHSELLIGLGASSISDTWNAFAQNVKTIEEYQNLLAQNILPLEKGHFLNAQDLILRKHILNIMCKGFTSWKDKSLYVSSLTDTLIRLKELENDGLVVCQSDSIQATELGNAFLRNIALQFDERYWQKTRSERVFSRGI